MKNSSMKTVGDFPREISCKNVSVKFGAQDIFSTHKISLISVTSDSEIDVVQLKLDDRHIIVRLHPTVSLLTAPSFISNSCQNSASERCVGVPSGGLIRLQALHCSDICLRFDDDEDYHRWGYALSQLLFRTALQHVLKTCRTTLCPDQEYLSHLMGLCLSLHPSLQQLDLYDTFKMQMESQYACAKLFLGFINRAVECRGKARLGMDSNCLEEVHAILLESSSCDCGFSTSPLGVSLQQMLLDSKCAQFLRPSAPPSLLADTTSCTELDDVEDDLKSVSEDSMAVSASMSMYASWTMCSYNSLCTSSNSSLVVVNNESTSPLSLTNTTTTDDPDLHEVISGNKLEEEEQEEEEEDEGDGRDMLRVAVQLAAEMAADTFLNSLSEDMHEVHVSVSSSSSPSPSLCPSSPRPCDSRMSFVNHSYTTGAQEEAAVAVAALHGLFAENSHRTQVERNVNRRGVGGGRGTRSSSGGYTLNEIMVRLLVLAVAVMHVLLVVLISCQTSNAISKPHSHSHSQSSSLPLSPSFSSSSSVSGHASSIQSQSHSSTVLSSAAPVELSYSQRDKCILNQLRGDCSMTRHNHLHHLHLLTPSSSPSHRDHDENNCVLGVSEGGGGGSHLVVPSSPYVYPSVYFRYVMSETLVHLVIQTTVPCLYPVLWTYRTGRSIIRGVFSLVSPRLPSSSVSVHLLTSSSINWPMSVSMSGSMSTLKSWDKSTQLMLIQTAKVMRNGEIALRDACIALTTTVDDVVKRVVLAVQYLQGVMVGAYRWGHDMI